MENPKNRKKKYHRNIGLISSIVVFVLLVFALVVMEMGISQLYHKNARESAEDDVVLAGVEVSAKITNVSLEQRISSQMIARDLFLVEWANNETEKDR